VGQFRAAPGLPTRVGTPWTRRDSPCSRRDSLLAPGLSLLASGLPARAGTPANSDIGILPLLTWSPDDWDSR